MLKFRQAYDNIPEGEQSVPAESYEKKIDGLPYDLDFIEINIKTIDGAVHNWFTTHPIMVEIASGKYRIPVIWSSAERFAMMNMENHLKLHDESGLLMLPIISIKRDDMQIIPERTPTVDKSGTTNFRLYVREYLSPVTNEKTYQLSPSDTVISNKPIIEIIEVQAPKVFRFRYSVTCWSKYYLHDNPIKEEILMKFGQHHAVYASENLWFGAYIDNNSIETNEENLGNDEKIIKSTFNIIVEAPLIKASSIRRRISVQKIDVDVVMTERILSAEESKSLFDDDPYKMNNF